MDAVDRGKLRFWKGCNKKTLRREKKKSLEKRRTVHFIPSAGKTFSLPIGRDGVKPPRRRCLSDLAHERREEEGGGRRISGGREVPTSTVNLGWPQEGALKSHRLALEWGRFSDGAAATSRRRSSGTARRSRREVHLLISGDDTWEKKHQEMKSLGTRREEP